MRPPKKKAEQTKVLANNKMKGKSAEVWFVEEECATSMLRMADFSRTQLEGMKGREQCRTETMQMQEFTVEKSL